MDRERRWIEYERSHATARRVLTLTVIVLLGMLLGYGRGSDVDAPVSFTAGSVTP